MAKTYTLVPVKDIDLKKEKLRTDGIPKERFDGFYLVMKTVGAHSNFLRTRRRELLLFCSKTQTLGDTAAQQKTTLTEDASSDEIGIATHVFYAARYKGEARRAYSRFRHLWPRETADTEDLTKGYHDATHTE